MMMISENDPLFKSSASSGSCHLVIGSTIHVTSRNCSCNLQYIIQSFVDPTPLSHPIIVIGGFPIQRREVPYILQGKSPPHKNLCSQVEGEVPTPSGSGSSHPNFPQVELHSVLEVF